ncbi:MULTISPECIES: DUF2267 domain-containing protein [unclassified Imperialibacter]|uniref:DUF2267 domain-containing protein n=1 Tax=unclassified Imperialibacter TaxID=2629706 RepID=UPI00125680C3|nr:MULTISPECIES: DUF2267 domain-containing protein [unclassified Imperialibacter]CAD5265415.1 conserved hypothetical protein [Imperialibacter sp. 89]CAD5270271.1 conserved hypothetical protein [Imperialibacter sp. 75]VVT09894.1 conserved hypothetical protein [Imperialibacter sp. EC-SDR9]
MVLDFEKYAMRGNEFIHQLEANLGVEDRAHAARILRSTFRVLRRHITTEESMQLLAQLPMALKAVYVDGWKLDDYPRVKNVDDFLVEIAEAEGSTAWRDFGCQEEILEAVKAVIRTMALYISQEEISHALGTLPKKINEALAKGVQV